MDVVESKLQSQGHASHTMSEDVEVTEPGISGKLGFQQDESRKLVTEDVGKNTNKISNLEKEAVSLWKQILDLTDENALLEAEKGKIEKMGKVIEGLKEQVSTAEDEISKLKEELFTKVILHTELMSTVKSMEQTSDLLNERFNLQQAKETELHKQISSGLSEIAKRDEQITELYADINQLKVSHKAEEDRWYIDTERSETKLRENHERKVLALNQKIQRLKDDNAIFESEKANRPINQRKKIETMGELIKTLRKQLSTAVGEILKLKQQLSDKEFDLNQFVSVRDTIASLQKQLESKGSLNVKMREKLIIFAADISKRDDKITELKSIVTLLRTSYVAKLYKWKADTERLKSELREKCGLVEDLNQKHEALMSSLSCTDELKQRVAELERSVEVISEEKREAIRQLSVSRTLAE